MDNIGNIIKKLRTGAALTQEELAEKMRQLGVLKTDRVTISKWERGFQDPGITALKVLGRIFGLTLDEISGNDTKDKKSLTDEEMDLLEQFRLASPDQQVSILILLRASLQIGK